MLSNKFRLTFLQKDIPAQGEQSRLYGVSTPARPAQTFEVTMIESHLVTFWYSEPSVKNNLKAELFVGWQDDEGVGHSFKADELVWFTLENL